MKYLLALDPSSTRTGFAFLTVPPDSRTLPDVLQSGAFNATPERKYPTAEARMVAIAFKLVEAASMFERDVGPISHLVVETPMKGYREHRGRSPRNLMTYALAAGYIAGAVYNALKLRDHTSLEGGVALHLVPASTWTAGIRKSTRLDVLQAMGDYTRKGDAGGDIGDAVMIGRWAAHRLATNGGIAL